MRKRDTGFDAIAAPTNYDFITQQFNTMVVENVIELVRKANPNAIMVITSTVPVRYFRPGEVPLQEYHL